MAASEVHTAVVASARQLSPHVRELTLLPEGGSVDHSPGQWLSLRLPLGDRPPLVRAYSLAAPPRPDGSLVLCFDHVEGGLGSGYLWDVEPGTQIEFTGPVGNFVLPEGDSPLVFVARYTGIVPLLAMLRTLENGASPACPVYLIYGAPSDEELVYHSELTALADRAADWFRYHPVVAEPSPEWTGETGDELSLLVRFASPWLPFSAMICGVREFTRPIRDYLTAELGLDRRSAKVENYNGPTTAR